MDKPTIPKGTRDFGPAQMAKRQFIFDNIRKVFQKYGFQPLETPTMENLSTLTGKYGEEGDQLLFKVLNSGDYLKDVDSSMLETRNSKLLIQDISEKGLRYDLTVPFARYVVMNRGEIAFPFKRYQIQPVWRADRPQKGRYREFYQCDADVVGTDSLVCEAEIVLMIKEVFKSLGIKDFTIKINHRAILSGLAELTGSQNESSLFVAIDKLDKIGEEKVKEELRSRGFEDKGIDSVFAILNFKGSTQQKIDFLKSKFSNSENGKKGIADFEEVLSLLQSYGATEQHVEFDISLARGLSYYTGCIFEVKINNVAIGSVSGGGRYDNLTGVFGLPDVSGVGISFGVDRLYDAMEELKLFPKEAQVSSNVMLAHFDDATLRYSLNVANQLRESGISTEVYPDVTKLKKQLDYANRKEIPFVVVVGTDEMKDGMLTVKDMDKGEQVKLSVEELLFKLRG
ncbi:MAG: histidine--tRNA ligase [Cytophagales bacterium]|jgi:histidyl-tRNA synthetase|nr:histidine--tRNA ligase [Cytophagales bacterium]MCA6388172.1 histidine--tRNA ligase [Cytophagales bacterium]MCA6391699.1 histidine--tRNA ligase [Cytophagales bacterium]MCA6399527.1 histidine--tRNA ligase [Cytophagales bacterium]MCA6402887.1 histidine--tRNA ligase [Cytophagales bacterium]